MNFKKGDRVVHKNFGVGIVVLIEGVNFSGNGPHLFYRVDFNRTTVWVPVGNRSEGGLRPITPKNHLDQYRALLKSPPVLLDDDFRKRHSELEKRMARGTFQGLCEVIRDLNALSAVKPLNYYERTLFKQSREALVSEWSVTSGLSQSETMGEIDRCLKH
ncbi:MAG: CarD family transcriptional regulator [Anaerolineales bacterium]|jgi:RNA polymerase-interacting CarD/CdnL/TRCF family regulator